jgi:CobQ-like glutamine amidotransferase family enzyme/UDP-N-acetylmuramyl tripeptide synthase
VFGRNASNFPGKLGLLIEPRLISKKSQNLSRGSICVVGTNGKTTTANLLADALQQAGFSVCCNRTGANMDSGIASALLYVGKSQWGVFECDELWLLKVLPALQSDYVVLLNLFRDQLDRSGEIEFVQKSILEALAQSPRSVLVYNADDPFCATIALRAPNPNIAFGVESDLDLPEDTMTDGQICQNCSAALAYSLKQYPQLGMYHCPCCGFRRPPLDFAVGQTSVVDDCVSLTLCHAGGEDRYFAKTSGAYMAYNLAAAAATATLAGCGPAAIQQALVGYRPRNGRLQHLALGSHDVLLNFAKNPTGMNQSLAIALKDARPFTLAIFINDNEADGRDVSWLWDADFRKLSRRGNVQIAAGGTRRNDLQVRLKYADAHARLVSGADEILPLADALGSDSPIYVIANYTALPAVKTHLEKLSARNAPLAAAPIPEKGVAHCTDRAVSHASPLVIAHLFPDLLNLYGDKGNVAILERRLAWRGIPVEIRRIRMGESLDLSGVDLAFLGGGPDREQAIASRQIAGCELALKGFMAEKGACLAICGGFQMLGRSWALNGAQEPGLGIGSFETRRSGFARQRLVGNIALRVPGIDRPVIGYENHAGRTYLSPGQTPFGKVISRTGHGNNDKDAVDGYVCGSLVATYLHGPLLAKNPEVADRLLEAAVAHWAWRKGAQVPVLEPLDDAAELAANAAMAKRMGVRL